MTEEQPDKLRPYLFHGVGLGKPKNNECSGECPFCGREDKFFVNAITGKWRCWVCEEGTSKGGGNIYTFLRLFHEMCFESTKVDDYKRLAENRGYLDAQPLIEWGLAKSTTTGEWLIPGYNLHKSLTSLYRYVSQKDLGYRLLPTPTLGHQLHGINLWDERKPIVYLCEGPWDGMALWELLTKAKNSESHLVPTSSIEYSLYASANVIAVPGCRVFFESWASIFENKIVNLMFDSDHSRKHQKTGHLIEGAGYNSMKRIAETLNNSAHRPQEINYLRWGENGFDPSVRSGFDVRDFLNT